VSLPDQIQDWGLNLVLPVKNRLLGSVRFSSSVHQGYLKGSDWVGVLIGLDDRLRRDRDLLSGKNACHEATEAWFLWTIQRRGLISFWRECSYQ
jgi:hypothetical protein